MKQLLTLAFILTTTVLGISPVLGQGECSHAQNHAELLNCVSNLIHREEELLNQTSSILKGYLSKEAQQSLALSQNAWLEYREKHCELEREIMQPGNISEDFHRACLLRLTKGRISELKSRQRLIEMSR